MTRLGGPPERSEGGEGHWMVGLLRAHGNIMYYHPSMSTRLSFLTRTFLFEITGLPWFLTSNVRYESYHGTFAHSCPLKYWASVLRSCEHSFSFSIAMWWEDQLCKQTRASNTRHMTDCLPWHHISLPFECIDVGKFRCNAAGVWLCKQTRASWTQHMTDSSVPYSKLLFCCNAVGSLII